MKKLRLELDLMRVESFTTEPAAKGRGTVVGNSGVSTDCSFNPPETCLGNTCWDSCGGSCDTLCGWIPSKVYYNGVCV